MGDLDHQQQALLEKGIIDIQGPVDDDTFNYVRECMLELALKDNPPIHIIITSTGGKIGFGLCIHDMLRMYPGEIVGTVIGVAQSAAALILQACDKRECSRNSSVLVHDVRHNQVTLRQMNDETRRKQITRVLQETQNQVYSILEERMNKPRQFIIDLCDEERELFAQEALELGLIDEIV